MATTIPLVFVLRHCVRCFLQLWLPVCLCLCEHARQRDLLEPSVCAAAGVCELRAG